MKLEEKHWKVVRVDWNYGKPNFILWGATKKACSVRNTNVYNIWLHIELYRQRLKSLLELSRICIWQYLNTAVTRVSFFIGNTFTHDWFGVTISSIDYFCKTFWLSLQPQWFILACQPFFSTYLSDHTTSLEI